MVWPAAQQPAASQPAVAAEPDTATGPETDLTDSATIVVQDGDTLDGIAQSLQVTGGWPALYEANHDTIGDNPDLILVGQSLRLP